MLLHVRQASLVPTRERGNERNKPGTFALVPPLLLLLSHSPLLLMGLFSTIENPIFVILMDEEYHLGQLMGLDLCLGNVGRNEWFDNKQLI